MGACASQKKMNQEGIQKAPQQSSYKLSLDLQAWPLITHVNFKDQNSAIKKKAEIRLFEGKKIDFAISQDEEKQNEYKIQINSSRDISQNSLKCRIKCSKDQCSLQFFDQRDLEAQIWRSATDWVEISERDVYRIGNTCYRVIKYVQQPQYKERQVRLVSQRTIQSHMSLDEMFRKCRVCYSSKQTDQNPLINPCRCTGSIEFIHLDCLGKWLFGQIEENTNFFTIKIERSRCEICKTNITETDAYKTITASLLSGGHKIATPFVILEGNYTTTQGEKLKNYMVLSFANKDQYVIGRSQRADICDKSDQYISRINSVIAMSQKKLFIKDNQSKHGTGIKLNYPLILSIKDHRKKMFYKNLAFQFSFSKES